MKIALKDIKPNPYRNLGRYPLSQPQVDQLVRSIQSTEVGFWDNVVVRKNGDSYELAYGHHRIEAARQAGLKEADFIVKKLSDGDMLKVMTLENENNHCRTQGSLLIESVEALVKAIAQGTIEVELPETGIQKDKVRTAPSFVASSRKSTTSGDEADSASSVYTPLSIAQFLGKTKKSGNGEGASEAIRAVVDALELVELKILKRAEIDDALTLEDLQRRVREGWQTYEERERQKLAREREEEILAKRAKEVKEAEARELALKEKNKKDQEKIQARIDEEKKAALIAEAERRDADTAAAKAKAQQEKEEAQERRRIEEERAKEAQKEFKRKAAELEAATEARRQREAAAKARIEERQAKPDEPRIPVEEPAKFSELEVLQAGEKSQQWAQTMLDRSRAMKQRDTLTLKRIKDLIEANQKIWNKLAVKFQKA